MARPKKTAAAANGATAAYRHPDATTPLRPDVGTQAQFKKKKAPAVYRYDSSLSPALAWDGQNGAREIGEWLLARIDEASRLPGLRWASPQAFRDARGNEVLAVATLADAVAALKRLSRPFLDWAGKAERLSFEVPTLPLFVHERLSTKAILESLKGHRREQLKQGTFDDLYNDPAHPISDQVLKAYEHQDEWQNRMVLGDSLVVMNSLLKYEGLGGQVQMIYIDPPYGVKFGSNFQPFVRKRDVKHGDDDDLTVEPEMVKAYRDTWELGLHSYLTYLRDRLLTAHELLHKTGALFVQIGDENVHHVRELCDEVFGANNFVSLITFVTTTGSTGDYLSKTSDYILFYARDRESLKYREPYSTKGQEADGPYSMLDLPSGERRRMTAAERLGASPLPDGARVFRLDNLQSQSGGRQKGEGAACWFPVEHDGRDWRPSMKATWKTNEDGMKRLKVAKRFHATSSGLYYVRFVSDFPVQPLSNNWDDTVIAGFSSEKAYVVETSTKVIQRCMLMTTDPGDLVIDPTCGSGTTAYVAEQWGRRWITIDTSRVPLALARQRLLTATFPYYELKDEKRGPAGGFHYVRKQNKKGEEVGGIVPHVTLKSIANDEPPAEEVLVDRPEQDPKITRISGPFVVEGTIPAPIDWDGDGATDTGQQASDDYATHKDRMLDVLRRSPVLHLDGNKKVTLTHVRPPAKTLSLSAEARVEGGDDQPVAIVFGPENGAVAEKLVFEAAKEANGKGYAHLYVIGFAIAANARKLIESCADAMGIAATYVQCTPDLMMGDLLKNLRSSQIFSVCGLPEVVLHKASDKDVKAFGGDPKTKDWYRAELVGLDVFDPGLDKVESRAGSDVPCWMVDADYNGTCFKATQVFFPRTAAWDDLKRDLKGQYDDAVWAHLAGALSTPFRIGEHRKVAVKVIDDRGNELLVEKDPKEAKA